MQLVLERRAERSTAIAIDHHFDAVTREHFQGAGKRRL